MIRIGELFDFFAGHADGFHDLELISQTCSFGSHFSLGCFSNLCSRSRAILGHLGSLILRIGIVSLKVFTEELHLTDNFV